VVGILEKNEKEPQNVDHVTGWRKRGKGRWENQNYKKNTDNPGKPSIWKKHGLVGLSEGGKKRGRVHSSKHQNPGGGNPIGT